VTNWAFLLLVIYVTLGLSRIPAAKAIRVAVLLTTIVVGLVVVRTGASG
jgi:hypothetical protein